MLTIESCRLMDLVYLAPRSGEVSQFDSGFLKNVVFIGWLKMRALLVERQRKMVTSLSYEINISFGEKEEGSKFWQQRKP